MQVKCLLLSIIFFVGCRAEFEGAIAVNVVGTEITITLPKHPNVTSVFFSSELDDDCSFGYNIIHNVSDSNSLGFKHYMKNNISDNQLLKVFAVFEANNQVITKNYLFNFNQNGMGVEQEQPEICHQQPIDPVTQRPSLTEPEYTSEDCIVPEWSPNVENNELCSGNLIFEDNFNDLQNWQHRIFKRSNTAHVEFTEFVANERHSRVHDGHLHIMANLTEYTYSRLLYKLENCTSKEVTYCGNYNITFKRPGPTVRSALLRTTDPIKLKYGRYEIRARLPIGDWLVPYLILQPNDLALESVPGPHIRLAYARGNSILPGGLGGNTLFGSAFVFDSSIGDLYEDIQSQSLKNGALYGDSFHNYTMIWHSDRIIFKVDGKRYGTITNELVLNDLNNFRHYYMALGLTAGGKYNFPDHKFKQKVTHPKALQLFRENFRSTKKTWTHPKLVVDYVRVYATHPEEE